MSDTMTREPRTQAGSPPRKPPRNVTTTFGRSDDEPDESDECCTYRDHGGNYPVCACPDPKHKGDPIHPFANISEQPE